MRNPTQIGELLVQKGLISRIQLDRALELQRSTGEFLGALLVKQGWLTPQALLETLGEQFGMAVEMLTPERVDWQVAKGFPPSALSGGRCFPIRATAETLTVAIADPLDVQSISEMERLAHFRRVVPVLVAKQALLDVVEAWRRQSLRSIEDRLRDPI